MLHVELLGHNVPIPLTRFLGPDTLCLETVIVKASKRKQCVYDTEVGNTVGSSTVGNTVGSSTALRWQRAPLFIKIWKKSSEYYDLLIPWREHLLPFVLYWWNNIPRPCGDMTCWAVVICCLMFWDYFMCLFFVLTRHTLLTFFLDNFKKIALTKSFRIWLRSCSCEIFLSLSTSVIESMTWNDLSDFAPTRSACPKMERSSKNGRICAIV